MNEINKLSDKTNNPLNELSDEMNYKLKECNKIKK